jgi:hypothetical protein
MNWWEWVFSGIGVLGVSAFIEWLRRRSRLSQHAGIDAKGAKVANSPVASGSDITQNIGDTHYHYPPPFALPLEGGGSKVWPKLEYVKWHKVKLGRSAGPLGVWVQSEEGPFWGLLLTFQNTPSKIPGGKTLTAKDVTAHLDFINEVHIAFGYWVGEYTHFATFEPGEIHSLIVVIFDPVLNPMGTFTLDNSITFHPLKRRYVSPRSVVVHHPDEVRIDLASGVLEATLVDSDDTTVYNGRFNFVLGELQEAELTPA